MMMVLAALGLGTAAAQQYYNPFQRQPVAPYTHYAAPQQPSFNAQHDKAEVAMLNGDYAEAFCIWQPLAAKGDLHAQYSLGWMYHNGYGLAIDDSEAERWWQSAAKKGDADASYALAILYVDRPKKTRELAKAMPYLVAASAKGHEDARDLLGDLATRGHNEAREAIVELFKKAPEKAGAKRLVKGKRVNFRDKPSTDGKVVGQLVAGTELITLRRKGDWFYVGVLETKALGWIYANLTELAESPQ